MNRALDGLPADSTELLHRCKGGCGEMIEPREFSCRDCWARLPRQLQIGVCSCWNHQMQLMCGVLERAVEWFERNPQVPARADSERARSAGSR